jgi:phosphohistidine swiveling domain-containing protein
MQTPARQRIVLPFGQQAAAATQTARLDQAGGTMFDRLVQRPHFTTVNGFAYHYTLDFAVPTQVDDPLPILVTLQALIQRPPRDGDGLFARLAHEREALTRSTARSFGPIDLAGRESARHNETDDSVLSGFAVSPGKVTAPASVILSPADFGQMQPGTVLVCPTTTPAWTPLFSQSRALVTDIGGILAHGSIVVREYGIPAVMGTGIATRRIRSGQVLTVDGDTDTVTLEP